jgi:hypothetical protein
MTSVMGLVAPLLPRSGADVNERVGDSEELLGRLMLQSKRHDWIAPTH